VNKWETIVNEGDVSNSIIFVAKGMMRQYYYKNGKDITEHFTYENGILTCLESFFNRTPSRIIVEAIEPAVVFEFFYDDIQRLIEMSPAMNRFYMAMLQEALIISQQKSDASRFESARQRYIRLLNEHPEIVKRASMNQIASYLVMTPETLSRIRSAL
jgi:CRP-like cAMP-binding protein